MENPVWGAKEYDQHWETYNSPGRQFEYEREILKFLPLDKEIKIIDIGCGIGRLMHQIYIRGYENIEGVDISPSAIGRLRETYPDLKAHVGDARETDFSSYDLAIVTEVLEHLEDDLCIRLPKRWVASVPNGETIARSHVRSYLPQDIRGRFDASIFYVGKWIIFGRL